MLERLKIMGVLNITPDSFSDGGEYLSLQKAVKKIKGLVACGAHYIDLGAESTRPGSKPINHETEWDRLEPVLNELLKLDLKTTEISLDSKNPETLIKACGTGAISMINDVSGVQDPKTLKECLDASKAKGKELSYCAMHMHLTPESMQTAPLKGEQALSEVETFFHSAHQQLVDAGFCPKSIFMDPGIGFGKDDAANLLLIAEASNWSKRFNLLYGVSRKSFLGRLLDISTPKERDPASKSLEFSLATMGVSIIRTHDVEGLMKFQVPMTKSSDQRLHAVKTESSIPLKSGVNA